MTTSVLCASAVGGHKSTDDREPLEHQENVNKIKGSQARNVMMQKLMRRSEVCYFVIPLHNTHEAYGTCPKFSKLLVPQNLVPVT